MSEKLDNVLLLLSDARGTYIPRDFVTNAYNKVAVEHCQAWGEFGNILSEIARGMGSVDAYRGDDHLVYFS